MELSIYVFSRCFFDQSEISNKTSFTQTQKKKRGKGKIVDSLSSSDGHYQTSVGELLVHLVCDVLQGGQLSVHLGQPGGCLPDGHLRRRHLAALQLGGTPQRLAQQATRERVSLELLHCGQHCGWRRPLTAAASAETLRWVRGVKTSGMRRRPFRHRLSIPGIS